MQAHDSSLNVSCRGASAGSANTSFCGLSYITMSRHFSLLSAVSTMSVTGPSLVNDTCIISPKAPSLIRSAR